MRRKEFEKDASDASMLSRWYYTYSKEWDV